MGNTQQKEVNNTPPFFLLHLLSPGSRLGLLDKLFFSQVVFVSITETESKLVQNLTIPGVILAL